MAPPRAEPSYGIDAPPIVATFVMLAVILTSLGIFLGSGTGGIGAAVGPWIVALVCEGAAASMVWTSRTGKPRLWSAALDALALEGSEHALDVGCGRGLVLIETAKRLPQGKATGIDIWRNKDQSGNSRVAAELNAEIAGVADRVEIVDGDMTELPFPDESFDLVTASLAIHNVALKDGRTSAVREIARVLRPGGRVLIIDIAKTHEYEKVLADCGLVDVTRTAARAQVYPPVRTVTARKPADRQDPAR